MLSQGRTTSEEQLTSINLYSAFVEFLDEEYAAFPYQINGVLPEALQKYLRYLKAEGIITEYTFKRIKHNEHAILTTLPYRTLT